jgi:hypothetical protein
MRTNTFSEKSVSRKAYYSIEVSGVVEPWKAPSVPEAYTFQHMVWSIFKYIGFPTVLQLNTNLAGCSIFYLLSHGFHGSGICSRCGVAPCLGVHRLQLRYSSSRTQDVFPSLSVDRIYFMMTYFFQVIEFYAVLTFWQLHLF